MQVLQLGLLPLTQQLVPQLLLRLVLLQALQPVLPLLLLWVLVLGDEETECYSCTTAVVVGRQTRRYLPRRLPVDRYY